MIDYDPHKWWHHLFDLRGSMAREIIGRVLGVTLFSVLVVGYDHHIHKAGLPSTLHSMVGFALGLLLVFRTNSSYDRFWEGRKQWGAIVNESRNLARTAAVHLRGAPELLDPLVRWISVFNHATMHRLRGTAPVFGPSASALPPGELEQVAGAQHAPLASSVRITSLLAEARRRGLISDYVMVSLDQNVQLLIDYMGACERIHKTPMPFAYMVHLRRALLLYCFTLPFGLVDSFGWYTVAGTFITSYIFFGIEEIGVEIEDPFGDDDNDLPLEQICRNIENNVMALVDPEKQQAAMQARPA